MSYQVITATIAILAGVVGLLFKKRIVDFQKKTALYRSDLLSRKILNQPQSKAEFVTVIAATMFIAFGIFELLDALLG